MAAAFDVSESAMASDTIFSILQFIKIVGMGCTFLHAQVCCDQKYVENLPVIYLQVCRLKLDLSFSTESYQTAFQTSCLLNLGGTHNFQNVWKHFL